MEMKEDDFRTLQTKVDQISSELDKQNTVRVVNTKWMIIVGAVILSALGFTNIYQLPSEVKKQVSEEVSKEVSTKVGPEVIESVEKLMQDLKKNRNSANQIVKKLEKISEKVNEEDLTNLPIGTTISSILNPSLFKKSFADPDKWVLADGREVSTDSKYYMSTNESRIPDLRGMFLRGMNEGRKDGKQDPEQGRKAGDDQSDALQQHGHMTNALGLSYNSPGKPDFLGYTRGNVSDTLIASVTDVKNANTEIETRPKNVAVYFYIKIN